MEVDWIDIIRRVYNRESPIIFSRFDYKITSLRVILTPLFNQEITDLVRERKAYELYDMLVKEGRMGGYWMLMTLDKRILIEKELYSKNWHINMPRSVEEIILLDLVQILYHKARQIEEGGIIITFDIKEMWRMANEGMKIANHYNQDAAVEGLVVDRLVREMNINIVLDKVYTY